MISRFTIAHIEQVMTLAKICDLSVWTFSDYLDEINRTDCIGFVSINTDAPLNQPINGFIVSRLIRPINYQSINSNQKNTELAECEILNIGVLPTMQRKGIGQKLLDATVLEGLRYNAVSVWLDVRAGNKNAFEFYRKNDFEVIYTRKNYYQNPVEDALVMKASLRKPF
jgi:ribosomal protein S18 acetylase RimI-like enzyme